MVTGSSSKWRQDIVEIGKRVYNRGFVAANDGNLSIKISENRLLITPAGVSKGFLSPEDIILCDMSGKKVEGSSEPSSEILLHLQVYRQRSDVWGVVHAHPPYATSFAVAGVPLTECILPEVVISIGRIPLAPYATPSTAGLAQSVVPMLPRHNAMLLANHGTLTIGSDIYQAYYLLERVEHLAKISLFARQLGGAHPLTQKDLADLARLHPGIETEELTESRCANCGVCGKPTGSQNAGDASAANAETISQVTAEVIRRLSKL
jgi:L-fuculose-phosphate aldolase